MTKAITGGVLVVGVLLAANPSSAATTEWMTEKQINGVMRSWGGAMYGTPPKFYATAVDCKDEGKGPRFRMSYTALSGSKPFYRWNWVHAKSSQLAKALAKLKRSDRPELKYRAVQQSSYVAPDGTNWSCAIAYR